MKLFSKIILAITLLFFVSTANAQREKVSNKKQKDSKNDTWLWEISGNGLKQKSYLYGTMHMMCADDFTISDSLRAKMNKSEQLVLEVVDADNPMNVMILMQAMAMKGKTLQDFYTEAEYNELNNFFVDSLGTDIEQLSSFSPFFSIIAMMPLQLGCMDIKSYETELTQLARSNNKEVKELETIEFQVSLFDTIPYAIQAKELLRSVREWTKEKQLFGEMVSIYKNKEMDKVMIFARSNFGALTEYWDIFLKNRNENWIPKIKAMTAEKSTLFAVGAAHLAGDYGLINLMRKAGYTVNPVLE